MKAIILTSFSLGFVSLLTAQSNEFPRAKKLNSRYWQLGVGSSNLSMYDEAISYVRYHGSGLALPVGLIKASEKKYSQFIIQSSLIKLITKRSNNLRPMEVSATRVLANYQHLVKINEWNEKLKLYAGGSISFLLNIKRAEQLDNSQFLYDYALSIGPSAKLDRMIRWNKRGCILSYDLSIPLLSHIARPYYLNRIEFIDPKNDFLGDLLKNSSLVSLNRHIRITSGLSMTYPLFNNNILKLGYNWDFYNTRTINNIYSAEHLISLAFLSNY